MRIFEIWKKMNEEIELEIIEDKGDYALVRIKDKNEERK
jgi:hypothetical protein